jgi:hypothetical protein
VTVPLITAPLIYEAAVSRASVANVSNADRYRGSIVLIKNWDEPVEAELFFWIQEACKSAAVLVRLSKNHTLPIPQNEGVAGQLLPRLVFWDHSLTK